MTPAAPHDAARPRSSKALARAVAGLVAVALAWLCPGCDDKEEVDPSRVFPQAAGRQTGHELGELAMQAPDAHCPLHEHRSPAGSDPASPLYQSSSGASHVSSRSSAARLAISASVRELPGPCSVN